MEAIQALDDLLYPIVTQLRALMKVQSKITGLRDRSFYDQKLDFSVLVSVVNGTTMDFHVDDLYM